MGSSIFEAIVAVFIWLFTAIFTLLKWIVTALIQLISSFIGHRKAQNDATSLQKLRAQLSNALDTNTEYQKLSNQALSLLKENTDGKKRIEEQSRYCKQVETKLNDALKDVSQDISKLNDTNFTLNNGKYSHMFRMLSSINYSVSINELKGTIENNSGWHNFIKEVLDFAGVQGRKITANEWSYIKDGFDFNLHHSESDGLIKITAKSSDPISHAASTKPVNKTVDDTAPIYFDNNNELVINLRRSLFEIDHYDVYEYFRSVNALLSKKEINEYAGKKRLSVREAYDIEDNVPLLLENIKKVAPPPVDYLPDHEKMHGGKQRWAQLRDIERAGMLTNTGFVIGKMGYGSYIHTGAYGSHILTIASTGSGKGVGVVIPNLLRHKGSAVILDPKGENFIVTAKHRVELGNRVFYFDPWDVIVDYSKRSGSNIHSNGIKASINPFDFIGNNDVDMIDKANMIASSLIMRENDKDSYFYDGAEQLITRLIVLICTKYKLGDERRNIIELRQLLTADKEFLLGMLKHTCNSDNVNPIVRELYNWLSDVIRTKNRGANDIYHFAQNATSFLISTQVQESLRKSNVDLLTMKSNPMSLFLILDMNKLTFNANYYKPLIRLIVTTSMMGVSQNEQPKDKVLFMLDEIAQLGTLQYLPNLLTIYRGKGVVVWTIWQNLSQIQEHYEKSWQTIVGNCDVQQFFGVNDNETAEYVSKLAGNTTIYEESFNQSQTHSTSRSESETFGDSYSRGTSQTDGKSSSHSYQGFNYTYSSGSSSSNTKSENYTDSYSFSRSIQIGLSETTGRNLAKKTAPLITPFEVTTGNAYDVQFVFYMSKCPYPIISGKIKYYEDKEYYGEYSNNVTRG